MKRWCVPFDLEAAPDLLPAPATEENSGFSSQVTEIRLKYFDTIPVATAMCVLKTGFLFVASEFGNQ